MASHGCQRTLLLLELTERDYCLIIIITFLCAFFVLVYFIYLCLAKEDEEKNNKLNNFNLWKPIKELRFNKSETF